MRLFKNRLKSRLPRSKKLPKLTRDRIIQLPASSIPAAYWLFNYKASHGGAIKRNSWASIFQSLICESSVEPEFAARLITLLVESESLVEMSASPDQLLSTSAIRHERFFILPTEARTANFVAIMHQLNTFSKRAAAAVALELLTALVNPGNAIAPLTAERLCKVFMFRTGESWKSDESEKQPPRKRAKTSGTV